MILFLTRGAVRGRWVGARWGRGRTHMPAVKTRLSTPSACAIVSSWCTCSVRDNCRVRAARGCVGVCTRVSGWHMEGGGASHLVEHRAQPIVQLPEARGQLLVRRGLRRRHEQTQKAEAVPAFVVATYLSFSSEDIGRYLCLLQNFDEDGSHSLLRAMAKSIRSKVKKRLRSVKRGVLKKDLQVCCGCPRTHTRTRAHTTPRFKSPRRSTISRQPPLASALHLLLSLSLSLGQDPATKVGKAAAVVKTKLAEACTGFIKPPKRVYNAFRYDEPEAIIPQHDWRQVRVGIVTTHMFRILTVHLFLVQKSAAALQFALEMPSHSHDG